MPRAIALTGRVVNRRWVCLWRSLSRTMWGTMSQGTEAKRPVSCPNCSKRLMAPASWVGKKLKCPQCQKPFACDFGQSTIETAQDRLRAKAASVGPNNQFRAIEVESTKVDPKVEGMRFAMGLGAAVVVCVLLTIVWHFLNASTGYVQPIPGYVVAALTGATMLFVSGKHGDILNAMLTGFVFVAVVCVAFWFLIAGGPELVKPRVPDARDAVAMLVGRAELDAIDRSKPEGNAKWEETLARIRKEKVEAMGDPQVDAAMEKVFDETRRQEIMIHYARELAIERDWPIEQLTRNNLYRDPKLIEDATQKAAKADIADIRNRLAEEDLDSNVDRYVDQYVYEQKLATGKNPEIDHDLKADWMTAARGDLAKLKPVQIDSLVRKKTLIAGAGPQKDAKPVGKAILLPGERYSVVLLVGAGIVAGAAAFGWKRFA